MSRKKSSKISDIVATGKKRFDQAKAFYSTARMLSAEDTRFAMGDSDNGYQWPADISRARKIDKRVCLTINIAAQHCNQVINNIRQNRPSVKVLPVDSKSDVKTAEILGGAIRQIQASNNADTAHDLAAEHAALGGEGYWRIYTDYISPSSFDQEIKIKSCPNPHLVYIDPDAVEPDRRDAKWAFIFEDLDKDEVKRDHPDIDPSSWGESIRNQGWMQDNLIRVAEYYYMEWVDDTAVLMDDGSEGLKSQLVPGSEIHIIKERPTKIKKWKWCKLVGGHDEPIEERELLGEYLPIITVVGKELNVNGEVIRKGLVRDIKDMNRMVNYAMSGAVHAIALQNNTPYIAAAEAIEGKEKYWATANTSNYGYLPFNAFDQDGNALPMPQRQQPSVVPTAHIDLVHLATEQMRAGSGQQNANFGIKSEAVSGVGIQRLKAQGEIATFHFPDNLARALHYEAIVLVDMIQKYYDTPRIMRIIGVDGKQESVQLNPGMGKSYHEDTTAEDIKKIFNPTLGKYDIAIDTGPSYQTQRQEAAANLNDIAAKNPQLMAVAGDLVMQAQDFPMADKFAARLAKTIPPELMDDENNQQTQAAQQQIQQLQQQLQAMHQMLQNVDKSIEAQDIALKRYEAEIKAYDAETKRIAAVQPMGLSEEQIQDIVLGTVHGMITSGDLVGDMPDRNGEEIMEQEPQQEQGAQGDYEQ